MLDLPRTIRLHASGRREQFAYLQGTVVRDEPLDRLVLAGLWEVDRAAQALSLPERTVYDARWLSGALDEVRDERFVATTRREFLAITDALQSDPRTNDDLDLARSRQSHSCFTVSSRRE